MRDSDEGSSPERESSSESTTDVDVELGVCAGVGLTPVLRGTELLAVELLAAGELLEVEVEISELASSTAGCDSPSELRSTSVLTSSECVDLEDVSGTNWIGRWFSPLAIARMEVADTPATTAVARVTIAGVIRFMGARISLRWRVSDHCSPSQWGTVEYPSSTAGACGRLGRVRIERVLK